MTAMLLPVRAVQTLLFRPLLVFACLAATVLQLQAAGTVAHPPGKRLLLFVGSNTLGEEAVPELAKAWMERDKKAVETKIESQGELVFVTGKLPGGEAVYVEIHATGSGDCFKSFLGLYKQAGDRCDIGMSSRRATEDEAAAVKEACGSSLHRRGAEPGAGCEHPVAMDGLAIIVHSSNPLARIAFSELKAIYSKETADWKEMREWKPQGGAEAGLPIVPMRRKEPSGTLDFFKERIHPNPELMKDEKAMAAFTSSGALAGQVAQTPRGIGFVGEGYADLPGIKRLQVYDDTPAMGMTAEEAVFPDRAAVRSRTYPLARFVYLYTEMISVNDDVKPFIQFALSEDGQAVISDKGRLVKVEGTSEHITRKEMAETAGAPVVPAASKDRAKNVILRLSGSNTVGAECAVNLAFNYFATRAQGAKKAPKIEDVTTAMETPEGEKALAHDVMCDLAGNGTWDTIEIRPTGSSDAFRDLNSGACDVGMSSRPISEAERRDLTENCGNLAQPQAQFALGLDGLAVIVSKDNPLEQISEEQLRRVFLGEITNWAELGGASASIQLHSRPERSGTYRYFCDAVLRGKSIPASAHRHSENALLAQTVAREPAAIGFVPMTSVDGAKVLKVGQEGSKIFAAPTEESVRAGQYPAHLCRYVYLYVPVEKPNSPNVMALQNWATAREFAALSQTWRGQSLVACSGLVTEPATMDEAGLACRATGEPVEAYVQRLLELDRKVQGRQVKLTPRLTNNEICPKLLFEFNEGSLTAESRSLIDMKLAPWLKMYPGTAAGGLVAEGWADSAGTDEACQKMSLRRAQAVADYVSKTLGCTVTAVGKGKSMDPPNTTEENKQINRRVVLKRAPAPETAAHAESAPPTPVKAGAVSKAKRKSR